MSWPLRPIPVRIAQFVRPVSGPGLGAATSVTVAKKGSAHFKLEYHWWIRSLWVTYVPSTGPEVSRYYPSETLENWEPAEGWHPSQMGEPAAKGKIPKKG